MVSVRGLYDYQAQGEDELSVMVGKMIELTAVGESYAEGWSEGVDSSGRKVSFSKEECLQKCHAECNTRP